MRKQQIDDIAIMLAVKQCSSDDPYEIIERYHELLPSVQLAYQKFEESKPKEPTFSFE